MTTELKIAYCFRANNHRIIAAAVRVVTGAAEVPAAAFAWQPAGHPFAASDPAGAAIAGAYHIAPARDGWVIAYPDGRGVPFAASLSRQTRKFTLAIAGARVEGWDRGHPALTPPDAPTDLIDGRYFRDLIVPPAPDWDGWIHLSGTPEPFR